MRTFLAIHLAEITAEEMSLFAWSANYWGCADIQALDPLGRIHLFELKKSKVTASDAEQLTGYLLQSSFVDPNEWIKYWWNGRRYGDLQGPTLARCLAHTYVGQLGGSPEPGPSYLYDHPTMLLGRDKEVHAISDKPAWKLYWEKTICAEKRKDKVLIDAMLDDAKKRGWPPDLLPDLYSLTSQWKRRIIPESGILKPLFEPERGAVVWIVGPSFHEKEVCEGRVRRWRRANVDARCLEFEVRVDHKNGCWQLRVRREKTPQRDLCLRHVAAWGRANPSKAQQGKLKLKLELYDAKNPSDSHLDNGGGLLDHAKANLIDENGNTKCKIE
jgi:hypothetical protein